MKRTRQSVGVLSGVLLLLAPIGFAGGQQTIYRFDMGPLGSGAAPPGFIHVSPDLLYEAQRGWGWEQRNPADRAHDRDTPNTPFYHQHDHPLYDLLRDGVTVVGPNTFRVRVPVGEYRVTLYVGDLSPGEFRPKLYAEVNGVAIVPGHDLPGGQVRAYTGRAVAGDEGIVVRVEGRGPQRYFPLDGVVIERAEGEQPEAVTFTTYPDHPPTPEDYRRNWQRFIAEFAEDWKRARKELIEEETWSERWQKRSEAMRSQPGYRTLFASLTLDFDGLAERAEAELDFSPVAAALREAGLDGLIGGGRRMASALRAAGMQHALMGPGLEGLPQSEQPNVTPIRIRKPDGSFEEIPLTYSVFDPRSVGLFKRTYQRFLGFTDSPFLTIDEQRGAWFAGGLGDYSEPARKAFAEWAEERGYTKLATGGLPAPSRTWDFYRFYQFRLEATARFVQQVARSLLELKVPIVPGNGLLGPITVNHNTLHPPAAANLGLGCASWLYGGQKPSAEVLRATEEELGGHTQTWTAFYTRDPRGEVVDSALALAALSERACIWHQGTFLTGANRSQWLKALYHVARLTHATSGLTRRSNLFVYTPDSLVYNDLVGDTPGGEADRWQKFTDSLKDANLDFRVTLLRRSPAGGLVIYCPVRAVLTPEECSAVLRYVDRGGTFVYACPTPPELPDGTVLMPLAERLQKPAPPGKPGLHWWKGPATPERVRELADTLRIPRNPDAEGLLTFAYEKGSKRIWLAINRQGTQPCNLILPVPVRDLFSGMGWPAKQSVPVPAMSYRMMVEN